MYNASLYAELGWYPLHPRNGGSIPDALLGIADARIYVELPANALPDWTDLAGTPEGVRCDARLTSIDETEASVIITIGNSRGSYTVEQKIPVRAATDYSTYTQSYIVYETSTGAPIPEWSSSGADVYFDLTCLYIRRCAPRLNGRQLVILSADKLTLTAVERNDTLTIVVGGEKMPQAEPTPYEGVKAINGISGNVNISNGGGVQVESSGGRGGVHITITGEKQDEQHN